MKAAVISDIHSNCFALEPVLKDVQNHSVDLLLILGDIFGYYPWAVETFQLLELFAIKKFLIKGNHDDLILKMSIDSRTDVNPIYRDAIVQNLTDIQTHGILDWLSALPAHMDLKIADANISLYHGTPADPLYGRFYPDSEVQESWFPENGRMVFLGHTHYPLVKPIPAGGVVANPGSVGQPRDGNPQPSWLLVELSTFQCTQMRSSYDFRSVQSELEKISWSQHAIGALAKGA
jgi:predicted phosphodiesterase